MNGPGMSLHAKLPFLMAWWLETGHRESQCGTIEVECALHYTVKI